MLIMKSNYNPNKIIIGQYNHNEFESLITIDELFFKEILNFIEKEKPQWLNKCDHVFIVSDKDGIGFMPPQAKCEKCDYIYKDSE